MIEPRLRRHRTHGRRQNLRHLCGNLGQVGEGLETHHQAEKHTSRLPPATQTLSAMIS